MSGLLLDQPAPGATTCLLIGPLRGPIASDFGRYRAVLWWVDPAHTDPLPPHFPRDRVQIGRIGAVGQPEIAQALERFVRLNPRELPSLLITDGISGPQLDDYQHVVDETHRLLESTRRARVTRQQDGFTWQKHILQNASAYAKRRLPASWAGALRGLPAFVCGAGPSLDVSIAKLAAAAERAVIFSADSALRALARHGVRADFAVSIDAAKIPEKCLPPPPGNPIGYPTSAASAGSATETAGAGLLPGRVVLASVSPPAWQDALPPDRQFFISGHQLTDDWFSQHGVARTAVTVTESCGSTAIELAQHLGCDPIYLFGLDLAVDPANQARRHQQDADVTLYSKSNYDPTAQLPRVPGNYAETVPSFALGDWRELDARLAARTDGQVFNVNDRGARLRGTTLVHPENFALASPGNVKQPRLAALPACDSVAASTIGGALARVDAVGVRCQQALPGLRRAFEKGGPAALAEAFRPVLLDPENGRALGAFALKLMPHLVPPIEGDRAFWQTLLTEFEELATLAGGVKVRTPFSR